MTMTVQELPPPDQKCFSFMNLPPEIRLLVYRYFFAGQPRLITYPFIRPFNFVEDRHWKLLTVSRDVYNEALPMYYRTCIFGVYELNVLHLKKLLGDMVNSHFSRYVAKLLVWRIPESDIFAALDDVKWVKLVGITCGVEPDTSNDQIYTYASLMKALRGARVPGFSWDRYQDLCSQFKGIDFMIDFRCDYPEARITADGYPQLRWVKTNFVFDVRENTFVEETRGTNRLEGLILRPEEVSRASTNIHSLARVFKT